MEQFQHPPVGGQQPLIDAVARRLHEEWKRTSIMPKHIVKAYLNGETIWCDRGSTPPNADILYSANLADVTFEGLPSHWQAKYLSAANFVAPAVMSALDGNSELSIRQTVGLACQVHEAWKLRHAWVSDPHHGDPIRAVTYSDLPTGLQYECLKDVLTTLTVVGSTIEVTPEEVNIPDDYSSMWILPGVQIENVDPIGANDYQGMVGVTIQDPRAVPFFYKNTDKSKIYGSARQINYTKVESLEELASIVNTLLSRILQR